MLRQSAVEKSKANLEQLAEQVQTIREAKLQSVEEMSAMLEPLAQALASLSSEAGKTLSEIQKATQAANARFQSQMTNATASLSSLEASSTEATLDLKTAASRLGWGHYSLSVLTGLLTALLVSAFWLWHNPPMVNTTLDPKLVAEVLKPALIEALKNGKEPIKGPGKNR